jgi:hypothetical protein
MLAKQLAPVTTWQPEKAPHERLSVATLTFANDGGWRIAADIAMLPKLLPRLVKRPFHLTPKKFCGWGRAFNRVFIPDLWGCRGV